MGYLNIALSYDASISTLFITVLSAKGLTYRQYYNTTFYPNPFVKIYLLPGRKLVLSSFLIKLKTYKTFQWLSKNTTLYFVLFFTGFYRILEDFLYLLRINDDAPLFQLVLTKFGYNVMLKVGFNLQLDNEE